MIVSADTSHLRKFQQGSLTICAQIFSFISSIFFFPLQRFIIHLGFPSHMLKIGTHLYISPSSQLLKYHILNSPPFPPLIYGTASVYLDLPLSSLFSFFIIYLFLHKVTLFLALGFVICLSIQCVLPLCSSFSSFISPYKFGVSLHHLRPKSGIFIGITLNLNINLEEFGIFTIAKSHYP